MVRKIMFVCLGNICRSTMAEALFKSRIKDLGKSEEYFVASGGTYAEVDHGVHRGTRKKLGMEGIDVNKIIPGKTAHQVVPSDYNKFDKFYCMDERNLKDLKIIFAGDKENKVELLLDRNIRDPWYTGNFDETYEDICVGINNILGGNK